ncbi:MAG: T9SS type A sorting domain-containing protein [Bacteroidales bacterium]|nr:T9SS type A sorting domain-containing protein [Bacteroidales bacterium]
MFKRLTLLWLLIAFSFGSLFAGPWHPTAPGPYTLTSTGNGYGFKVNGASTEYSSIDAFKVASGEYTITFNTTQPVWLTGRILVTQGTLNLKLGPLNESTTDLPTLRRHDDVMETYCIEVYNDNYASSGSGNGKLNITGNTNYQFCIHGGRGFTINCNPENPVANWTVTFNSGAHDLSANYSPLSVLGGTATLKYVTIYNSCANYYNGNRGGAVTVNGNYGNSTLNMTNCTITKCYSETSGGALLASSNFLSGTPRINISMKNCTISNCFTAASKTTSDGGTIRCAGYTSAKITMDGCTMKNNVACRHAGGLGWITGVVDDAFTIKNCTFSNNKSGTNGGGCFLCGSGTIQKCKFDSNYAKSHGGGLGYSTYSYTGDGISGFDNFQTVNGTLVLDNTTEITGNTAGGSGGGVYFNVAPINVSGTSMRTIFKNKSGSRYEISLEIDGTTIKNNIANSGGGIFVQRTTGIYISDFKMNYGAVSSNTSKTNGGGVYVKSTNTVTIYGTCPYSPSIMEVDFGETGSTNAMYVQSNTASAESGGGVYVTGDGCNVKLLSGYIGGYGKTNTAKIYGGGIYVSNGNVTINDATVSYNVAQTDHGGGIYVTGSSTVTVSGSSTSIYQNTTGKSGGGIYMDNGTMTVSGGSIDSNTATNNGGGIYMNNGTMTVSGGRIYLNTATINGGGIYMNNGTMTVSGGSIYSNTATQNGGGIYAAGTITVEDGTINENTAAAGGGVYIPVGSTLNMYGAGSICNNEITGSNGGGVYQAGTMNVAGSSITVTGNTNAGGLPNNVYLPNYDNVITVVDHGSYYGVTGTTDIGISIPNITDNVGVPVIASENVVYLKDIRDKLTNPEATSALKDDRNMYQVFYKNGPTPYNLNQIFFVPTWQSGCADNQPASSFFSADPIEITTNNELAWFMCYVNGLNGLAPHSDANGKLMADVDMDDYIWLPMGVVDICHTYEDAEPTPYSGTFDGNGYVITGLRNPGLPGYMYYGLFGKTYNATVKNTFVIGCDFTAEFSKNLYEEFMGEKFGAAVGSIIGRMEEGTLAYSEGTGILDIYSNLISKEMVKPGIVGGLVGGAFDATIHSSMAMADMKGVYEFAGGLVGASSGGSIKNCFANPKSSPSEHTFVYCGGLAGGIMNCAVENCYLLLERGFGEQVEESYYGHFVGFNWGGTISNCYAPSNGDLVGMSMGEVAAPSYGIFHAPKAPYYYADQTGDNDIYDGNVNVGSTLTDALNAWVSTNGTQYSTWRRTMAGGDAYDSYGDINDDYPIPAFTAQGYTTVGSNDGIVLDYFRTIDQVLTRHNDDGILEGGTLNLYKNDEATQGTDEGVVLYIDEDVSILQTTGEDITAVTCQTMTKPGETWHLVSSSLAASPIGFTYGTTSQVAWQDDVIGGTNNPCGVTLNSSHASSLFPTDAPVGAIDLYSFSEPYYHWINLKRNSASHWHMNAHSVNIPYTNETALTQGKGYLAAIDKAVLLEASGTLNNGEVTIPVTIKAGFDNTNQGIPATEGTELKGYNLLGNPYQSYLSFAEFASANSSLWGGTPSYVVYDPIGNQYIPGSTDTPSSGSAAATGAINMHQGFFIVADNAGTATFTNDMRTNDPADGTAFRGERPAYPLINLMVKGDDGTNDIAVVEFSRPEYSAAAKMKHIGGNGKVYFRHNGEDCALLYLDEDIDNLPVRFETVEDGAYTLTWSTANATFSYLHLIDNMKGMDIDMLTSEGYTFQSTTSDYASRFKLVFAYTGVEEESGTATEHFAFVSNGNLIVNGTGMFEMIDMNGRVISATRLTDAQNTVALPNAAAGVYVLKLTDSANSKVQKVVIR